MVFGAFSASTRVSRVCKRAARDYHVSVPKLVKGSISTMSSKDNGAQAGPQIVQWFIDTRPLWPVKKGNARDEVQELKTVVSIHL